MNASLLYKLKQQSILVWRDPESDSLELELPDDLEMADELIDQLKENKTEILELLKYNQIDSYTQAQQSSYFKVAQKSAKLTAIQQGIYLQSKMDKQENTYNIPLVFRVFNAELEMVNAAMLNLLATQRILRMTVDQNLNYKILALDEFKVAYRTLSDYEIADYLQQQAEHVFKLDGGVLIKPELVQLRNSTDIIVNLTHHHILGDAYSVELIIAEFMTNLAKLRLTAESLSLTEIRPDYFDYSYFQEFELATSTYQAAIQRLVGKMNSAIPIRLHKRYELFDNLGDNLSFSFDQEVVKKLDQLAIDNDVTVYALLMGALYHVLSVFDQNEDGSRFPICLTVSNRPFDLNQLIGPLINSLPLIVDYDPNASFATNIQQINHEIIFLNQYRQLNLNILANHSKKSTSELMDLMQIMFTMHNFQEKSNLKDTQTTYEKLVVTEQTEKFGLTFVAKQTKDNIHFDVSYATSLYAKWYIQSILDSYCNFIYALTKGNFQQAATDIPLLAGADYQKIIYTWNNRLRDFSSQKLIQQLFEEQVFNNPQKIAVICNDLQLSYFDLNQHINQLANYLKAHNLLAANDLVAFCLDKNELNLITILAILKAGAAYIPLDPNAPRARLQFILNDTRAKLVISSSKHCQMLQSLNLPDLTILALDEPITAEAIARTTTINPTYDSNPVNKLAYVIYTSGTTGNPKGVMITEHSVLNYIYNVQQSILADNQEAIVDYSTNIAFDLTVTTTLVALCSGATVCVYTGEVSDIDNYQAHLIKHQVTLLKLVPSYFELICGFLNQTKVTKVILGGEKLSFALLKKVTAPNVVIYDEYGPTETTVGAFIQAYTAKERASAGKQLSIGHSYLNYTAYILDHNLRPLPVGSVGELYIGGAGLALGYLNQPELTAAKFIDNMFQSSSPKSVGMNARLYKSGDLACWLPDGSVEYIGRNDNQVKIRGFRIELGEIENCLNQIPGVCQAIVVAKTRLNEQGQNTGSKYLVAYYSAASQLNEVDILEHLNLSLPEYMLPSALVYLSKVPLTANGKLDYAALPEPEPSHNQDGFIAPCSEIELQLCEIFAEILGVKLEKIGVRDDFIRLGGDSISAIQVVSRLRQRLSLIITVKDIFKYKTIERLVKHVLLKQLETKQELHFLSEQGRLTGPVGLLPIQKWFFTNVQEGYFSDYNYWNQSFLVKSLGEFRTLDIRLVRLCFAKLVEFHDALNLRYPLISSEPLLFSQEYMTNPEVNPDLLVKEFDVRNIGYPEDSPEFSYKLHELLSSWQANFRLENGNLFQAAYLHGYQDGKWRIFLAAHHLIVDMVSWRIIRNDLTNLYQFYLEQSQLDISELGKLDTHAILGEKGTSYRQWVSMVENYACQNSQQKAYWQSCLVGADQFEQQLSSLVESEHSKNCVNLILEASYGEKLLTCCNRAYHSQINDLLLTALAYALNDLWLELLSVKANQPAAYYITLEGHGREEIDPRANISRTVGWFTTMFPVRLQIDPLQELGSNIIRIKEILNAIPDNGIGYGTLCADKGYELPRICFNYLGQLITLGEVSGISISPQNNEYNIININGYMIDGELTFEIASKLSLTNSQLLAQLFKKRLVQVIEHTATQTRSYLSTSDISSITNQNYLDQLQHVHEVEAVYLANSLQQGFIYHALRQGSTDDAYHVQMQWSYASSIDPNKLHLAWSYAQARFPSLRLRFAWSQELVQIIDTHGHVDWHYFDLTSESTEPQQIYNEIKVKDRLRPFDLTTGPLFRLYLFKFAEANYRLLCSNHHAILDGWSNQILLDYVHNCYLKLMNNQLIDIAKDESYAMAQNYLQEHANSQIQFWTDYLSGWEEYNSLQGLLREKKRTINLADYHHVLEPREEELTLAESTYAGLKTLSVRYGLTLNAVLQYAWHRTLAVYGGVANTIVGTTIAGRNLPIDNIENSVGLYINTLPIIVDHHAEHGLLATLRKLQDDINELNSRGNVNLATLHSGRSRLFDSVFVFENYPSIEPSDEIRNLNFAFDGVIEKLDYPLAVTAYEVAGQIIINLNYAHELFKQNSIQSLLVVYTNLLASIVELLQDGSLAEEIRPAALKMVDSEMAKTLLYDWNNTQQLLPKITTIHELVEQQVQQTPEAIALVFGQEQWSYRELEQKANQLANLLQSNYQVLHGDIVALCLIKSPEMIAAILAVLKAGAAYLPLDPTAPVERLAYQLKDSGAKTVIANLQFEQMLANLSSSEKVVDLEFKPLFIDAPQLVAKLRIQASDTRPQIRQEGSDLAYVIYTSGTTGVPKGVMIEHLSLVNEILFQNQRISFNRPLLTSNYVFDAAIEQIFMSLLSGAELHIIANQDILDIGKVSSYIKAKQIDCLNTTPSYLGLFNLVELTSLRHIILGGEALNCNFNTSAQIHNTYGPSEATIIASSHLLSPTDKIDNIIGRPIANTSVYVLDRNLNLVPIGAIGELYIGGLGLARGYLNREELTNEKFIANPFYDSSQKNVLACPRLYKTGDLVRWLANGELEYIGRNDTQVKIRGYRIELAEIESVMGSYPQLRQAVVCVKESGANAIASSGNKYLIGYYVADEPLDTQAILSYLAERLPDYMLPRSLVYLASLPLTANGKLDRQALPEPGELMLHNHVAPRNELEQQVCAIYGEVLGISPDSIGIYDDFFRLGGNSILAIHLLNQLNQRLFSDANINLTTIFRYKTIAGLLEYVLNSVNTRKMLNDQNDSSQVISRNLSCQAELSFSQARLWFIENYEGGSSAYNIPLIYQLAREVNYTKLKQALIDVVSRHNVLHSLIKIDANDAAYQEVIDLAKRPIMINDLGQFSQKQALEFLTQEISHVFKLDSEYPIRISIFTDKGTSERFLLLVVHHIAFDGWSSDIFIRDLDAYYALRSAKSTEMATTLPDLSIQYTDFAHWQRQFLSGKHLELQLGYWREQLSGVSALNLPLDWPRPSQINYRGAELGFRLTEQLSNELRNLAKHYGISLYTLLLAGFNLLLRAYSLQDDIVVGTPVANRQHTQVENLIGCFVNSLALRNVINPQQSIQGYLSDLADNIINAQLHQDLPFEKLVDELALNRDPSRHPIFQVMFSLQSFGKRFTSGVISRLDPSNPYEQGLIDAYKIAKFDLSLFVDDSSEAICGSFNYAVSLFQQETIARYCHTYQYLLEQLLHASPDSTLQGLSYLDLETYQQLVYEWNQTTSDFVGGNTLSQLFESQVAATPDNIAVVAGAVCLSYSELNCRANQLANYLRANYVLQNDDLIALCLERNEHMLIAILAVLKAGAGYVPLDPEYTSERINYILKDTQAKVVLASIAHQDKLSQSLVLVDQPIVEFIDSPSNKIKLSAYLPSNLTIQKQPSDLAYVIYTSGTTGQPKGVMIEEQSVVNTIRGLENLYSLGRSAKVTFFSAYVFDVSVAEIFANLVIGNELHILSEEVRRDYLAIGEYLLANRIEISYLPPVILANLARVEYPDLVHIIYAGEPCGKEAGTYWSTHYKLFNYYGPTETSIYSLGKQVMAGDTHLIGRPLINSCAYILDSHLKAVPLGGIGELYIGGMGVARGYLNQPELTKERFIPNPFQSPADRLAKRNQRIYKTGDLVRYHHDGNIEYLGRNDFQVKIRGFRIELGEIENCLSRYPGVKEAVVLARESTVENKYLVGYYVADQVLNETAILDYLSKHLASYMLPSVLVHLNKLPLTVNGKVDRQSLPAPQFKAANTFIAPRNELEEQLCQIYSEVLGVELLQIGITGDFFQLGGDSISSIQLTSRIRQRLKVSLSVKQVFSSKTVEKLSSLISAEKLVLASAEAVPIQESAELSGEFGLLPVQDWFFYQIDRGIFQNPGYWNQAFLIKVEELDLIILRHCLNILVSYHDSLRLGYNWDNPQQIKQVYRASSQFTDIKIKCLDASSVTPDEYFTILSNWQNGFKLNGAEALFSVGYLYGYADGSARIFFAFHHLLIDAISWRIIIEDLQTLYAKFNLAKSQEQLDVLLRQTPEELLGVKGTSYRQWVNLVAEYHKDKQAERVFWDSQLTAVADSQQRLVELAGQSYNHYEISLDAKLTELLLSKANQAYHTEINHLLLCAFGLALAKLTGNSTNFITLEGHGREEISPQQDISRTVGWFTSLFPLRLTTNSVDLAKNLVLIKEQLRTVPQKGIGYGALYGYRQIELPRVSFNYLGQFDKSRSQVESYWSLCDEVTGLTMDRANCDRNIIDANGLIINGKLQFRISGWLCSTTLTEFGEEFYQQLVKIIKYCSSLPRNYLTPSDVSCVVNQEYLDRLQQNRQIENIYFANSLQQGFIYHALNQEGYDSAYHVQQLFEYNNPVEPELLQLAWQGALQRFPCLRLRFAWENELLQIVDNEAKLNWRYFDLTNLTLSEQKLQITQLMERDRQDTFNLAEGRLLRVYLFQLNSLQYRCLLSNHHVILDGWSYPCLLNYVHNLYLQFMLYQNERHQIQQILNQIQNEESYTNTQQYLQEHTQISQNYWQQQVAKLDGFADLNFLLKDNQRTIKLDEYRSIQEHNEVTQIITGADYTRLKQMSQKYAITINAILQYCWHKVLSIYTNSSTTVVGTTVAGRNLPIEGIEEAVGMFINSLPLIITHNADDSILSGLQQVQDSINDINSHSNISLATLRVNARRLFESVFVFENYPIPSAASEGLIRLKYLSGVEMIDYPLAVVAFEQGGQINFTLKYAGELFSLETINNFLAAIQNFLTNLGCMEDIACQTQASHNYLDLETYQQLVYEWNQTTSDFVGGNTLSQLFESQVAATPDNIAVVAGAVCLSYSELNCRANQLANYLRANYVLQNDDLIALCLERNEHMLIAILAVLKAGAGYVPLDPEYTSERINYILKDTQAKVVLASIAHQDKLSQSLVLVDQPIVEFIDSPSNKIKLSAYLPSNLTIQKQPSDLAYVIYTSGTTGQPKGVMIEEQSVVNTIRGLENLYSLGRSAKVTFFSAYVFDVSVAEIFANLVIGNELHILSEEVRRDYLAIGEYLLANRIEISYLPPVILANLARVEYPDLVHIIYAGEPCGKEAGTYWSTHYKLFNYYGPTETSIYSLGKQVMAGDTHLIGRPLINSCAYILDSHLKAVPLGGIGELYIGGMGVARGYLNQPELTKERFIPNPFQSPADRLAKRNQRIYKTGDLVRYHHDGNIEYLGRNDFQVKIRGFRIELGEIENCLSRYPGVKEAVVLARESTVENKYLVGYYVADQVLNETAILDYLSKHLASYMLPSVLVHLNKLPLTVNGKVDRQSLPAPQFKAANTFIAPRNELEEQLCQIYGEVLGADSAKISVDADFFSLGGNSILAIKLMQKVNMQFGTSLVVAEFLINRTILKLAQRLIKNPSVYQPIIKLNQTINRQNLFMVHPAHAGSEVYQELASQLSTQFCCYGVESYNLNMTSKIDSLHQLALYYLNHIQQIMQETGQHKYNLFGWSFGGQICLEIAAILEQRGVTDITVYLLDSVLPDETIVRLRGNQDQPLILEELPGNMHELNSEYLTKVLANLELENQLLNQDISQRLNISKVILFKALLPDTNFEQENFSLLKNYLVNLAQNNLEKVIDDLHQLTIIKLMTSHNKIIGCHEEIVSSILTI